MNTAIISLGSNIRPKTNMAKAKIILKKEFEVLMETEPIFTKPLVFRDQADFLNSAMLIQTKMSFAETEKRLKEIEKNDLKRVKKAGIKAGPRTIDIDILVWNSAVKRKEVFEWEFLKKEVKELVPLLEKELGKKMVWAKNL
ncbi:MAG: 2-amino-4-hydroxy-6-hydroxymethyldihydropteridine diphosphokinase [archaeon]|nr:2-amino-4-hydroxy-6-hydroxymethyldihydropteridine diphosphokinase [archaeon]